MKTILDIIGSQPAPLEELPVLEEIQNKYKGQGVMYLMMFAFNYGKIVGRNKHKVLEQTHSA